MIRPNIAPGRVVGSAAAGMFSAAKSSVRRVDRMTETISRSPDVTKDQKFGINYVGFFGSKKNTKILKKSLKSIRDSLVATFGIAKLLRSEVSKNAKIIGEKVKGKKGLFGIGIGGILGLIGLLTNPIVLSVLGIAGGVAAGGFLVKLLYDNRDKIIGFIMDKARGLYDFFQQMVSNIVRGVFADRAKSPELRNVESLSEERIDKSIKDIMEGEDEEFKDFEGTEGEARILATKREIEFLKSEQQKLDLSTNQRGRVKKPGDLIKFDNYEARIKELETGKVTTDKLKGFSEFLFGDQIRGTIEREAVFLPPAVNYSGMSQQEKLNLLEMVYRKFQQEGNDPNRIIEVYQRALDQGNLSDDQQAQARDLIDYYKKMNRVEKDNTKESKVDDKIVPSSTNKNKIKNLSSSSTGGSGGDSGTGLGGGVSPKVGGGGGSDLVQNPVPAKSTPEMIVHANFDPDNHYRDSNASLLGIVA